MYRYHLLVAGRVQGVGFRYITQHAAEKTSVTGWVKNLYNGDVEIEVQGLEDNIANFITLIRKGNGFSSIENIDINMIDLISQEKGFKIKY
ncbi:acylphosphatase [Clostridium sp. MSJ-4]|uniref:Acylphosphatase n=1 Tax=Clostridium simiarum TaxID=2841506 RepID=A0ABS6EVK7_9CLOT|nr:acylphosphatase [Clostridium simiarum]MBU5590248.1 acylphosphatase [Clostridium simiarum]